MNRRLSKLVRDGLVKVHGSGRGTYYTLDYGQNVYETDGYDKRYIYQLVENEMIR